MSSDQCRLASAAYRRGQLREAVELCERGIARTEAQGEHDVCWRLRILLSQCLCEQGDFAGSIALLETATIGEDVSIKTRARVLNQKAFGLSRSGNFAGAKEALNAAIRMAEGAGSCALVGEIEVNHATLFFYLAKYDEMETCARTALGIGEKQNEPLIEASACAGMGKSHMYRERQAEAIPWFERALAIYENEGATAYADIMRSELGCCHFALHEFDKAFAFFTHALRVSRESGALASLHIDLANMGCLHLCRGEYAAAISHFQEALQIARKLGDTISVSKWLRNLALAYSHMGNPALSASFQKEAEEAAKRVDEARARRHSGHIQDTNPNSVCKKPLSSSMPVIVLGVGSAAIPGGSLSFLPHRRKPGTREPPARMLALPLTQQLMAGFVAGFFPRALLSFAFVRVRSAYSF